MFDIFDLVNDIVSDPGAFDRSANLLRGVAGLRSVVLPILGRYPSDIGRSPDHTNAMTAFVPSPARCCSGTLFVLVSRHCTRACIAVGR
jgi:hypothetical protein